MYITLQPEDQIMRMKLIIITIILCVTTVIAIALVNEPSKPAQIKEDIKPISNFYRGIDKPARYSKSYIQTPTDVIRLEPVFQGDVVEHDFLIRNPSDIPMEFGRVKSCCGIILTNNTPVILPGEEGKLSITVLTDKYGGKTIRGTLEAEALNPGQDDIKLDISLYVTKLASVTNHKIILKGSYSQTIQGDSLIFPEKDHQFNILGIKAKKGLHIDYNIKEVIRDTKKMYLIMVTNTKNSPGVYRDMLYVRTDSPVRPEIKIRVEGRISQ